MPHTHRLQHFTSYTDYRIYAEPKPFSPFKYMGWSIIDDVFCIVGKAVCGLICSLGMYYVLSRQIEARTRQENRIEEVYRKLDEEEQDELLQQACPDYSALKRACISKNQREQIVKRELRELILVEDKQY